MPFEGYEMNCPFIDSDNPHCSVSLNIRNLDEAFEICTGHFELCPLYIQMSRTRLETVAIPAVGEAGRRQTLKTCS